MATIPIRQLRQHPAQMRTVLDAEEMAQLVLQIKARGLDPTRPIVAASGADNTYRVISGHRRWMAYMLAKQLDGGGAEDARKLVKTTAETYGSLIKAYGPLQELYGDEQIEISLYQGSEDEELELLSHNFGQAGVDPAGLAHAFEMASKAGHSLDRIARSIGHHRRYVQNYMALLKLRPEIMARVTAGELSIGAATKIAELPDLPRAGLEAYLLERHGGYLSSQDIEGLADKLKHFDGFQPPLEQARVEQYHIGRILSAVWAEMAGDVGAWTKLASAVATHWHPTPEVMLEQLLKGTEFVTEGKCEGHAAINWRMLVEDYLPGVTCEACPWSQLPKGGLRHDLDDYPCRSGQPGPCVHAPIDGAPTAMYLPWQWEIRSRIANSVEELLQAYEEARQAERRRTPEAEDLDATGIQLQRARIAHYIKHHAELCLTHPLATTCATCIHHTDGSPTKNPDVPHCRIAARVKEVEFYVIAPMVVGPAIPVCRQYQPADSWTWTRRLPEYAGEPLPRALVLEHLQALADDVRYNYQATRPLLEPLTGGLGPKDQRLASSWFSDQLTSDAPNLSDGQLMTLLCLAMADWQRHICRESYGLLFGYQVVEYHEVPWSKWWGTLVNQVGVEEPATIAV